MSDKHTIEEKAALLVRCQMSAACLEMTLDSVFGMLQIPEHSDDSSNRMGFGC